MTLEERLLGMGWRARVGLHLRVLRRRSNLSQPVLADQLGVSVDTVRRAERGDVDVRAELVEAWERACGSRLLLVPEHQLVEE